MFINICVWSKSMRFYRLKSRSLLSHMIKSLYRLKFKFETDYEISISFDLFCLISSIVYQQTEISHFCFDHKLYAFL